jgi:Neuraminidase (sialidase)
VATNRRGDWVAVWSSTEDVDGLLGTDRDVFVSRSSDNGQSWSKSGPLNTNAADDPREDSSPVIVTDGVGNWLSIWHAWGGLTYLDGSDADIIVAYSRDAGRTWSDPAPINRESSEDEGDDLFPGIATDDSGHWVAIWQTFFSIPGNVTESEWRVVAAPGAIED